MLQMRQSRNITGECVINNIIVAGYSATIDSSNPNHVQFGFWINEPAMYKEHKAEARADQAAFEDAVYAIQEEIIAESGNSIEENDNETIEEREENY